MQILHLDEHLVAVYKPAGWLVHRSAIDRHETRIAMHRVRDQLGRRVYPVHRLDKPTAGVLLFALDAEVARGMGERFAAGEVRKRYLAIVRGHVQESGVIDYPLIEEQDALTDRLADKDKPPRPAITEYRRLAVAELPYPVGRYATARYSLVQALPKTGRKHQIRRHMKHIFHPVVGDTTHGDGKQNRLFRDRFGCARLLLLSHGMSFAHPCGDETIDIAAPPDEEFMRMVIRLGWRDVWPANNAVTKI